MGRVSNSDLMLVGSRKDMFSTTAMCDIHHSLSSPNPLNLLFRRGRSPESGVEGNLLLGVDKSRLMTATVLLSRFYL
jgi:hypothetical protein